MRLQDNGVGAYIDGLLSVSGDLTGEPARVSNYVDAVMELTGADARSFPRRVWEGLREKPRERYIPYAPERDKAFDESMADAMAALDRQEFGDGRPASQEQLRLVKERMEALGANPVSGELSVADWTAEILPSAVKFGGEFLAESLVAGGVGGALGMARRGSKIRGMVALLKNYERTSRLFKAAAMAGRGAGIVGRHVAAGELVPQAFGGEGHTTEQARGLAEADFFEKLKLSEDEAGELRAELDARAEDMEGMWPQALRSQVYEAASELGVPGSKLMREKVTGPFLAWMGEKLGVSGGSAVKALKGVLRRGQVHAPIGEFLEERESDLLHELDAAVREGRAPDLGEVVPGKKQAAGEAIAFSVLPGGMAITGTAVDAARTALAKLQGGKGETAAEKPAAPPTEPEPADTGAGGVEGEPPSGAAGTPTPLNEGASLDEGVPDEGVPLTSDVKTLTSPVKTPEAPESPPAAPEAEAAPEPEDTLERVSRAWGQPLEEVEAETEEQQAAVGLGERLGVKVRIAKGKGFVGASLKPGEVFIGADQASPLAVLDHELVHEWSRRTEGKERDILGLYQQVDRVDPAGLERARAAYREAFGEERYDALTADLQSEEALAQRAQELSGWIQSLRTPEGARTLRRIALNEPGVFRSLVDAVKRILRRLGVDVKTWQEGQLERIGVDLQGLKAARVLHEAISSLETLPVREGAAGEARFAAEKARMPRRGVDTNWGRVRTEHIESKRGAGRLVFHVEDKQIDRVTAGIRFVPGPGLKSEPVTSGGVTTYRSVQGGDGRYMGELEFRSASHVGGGANVTDFYRTEEQARSALAEMVRDYGLPTAMLPKVTTAFPRSSADARYKPGVIERQPGWPGDDLEGALETQNFVDQITGTLRNLKAEHKKPLPLGRKVPVRGTPITAEDVSSGRLAALVEEHGDFGLLVVWKRGRRQRMMASDFARNYSRMVSGAEVRSGDSLRGVEVWTPPERDGDIRFAAAPPTDSPERRWFSAVERGVESLKGETFLPGQLDAQLRKQPGVTEEELEYLDWKGLVADRKRKRITKAEALEWVRAHRVGVEEKVLGSPEKTTYDPERWYVFDYRQPMPGAPAHGETVADYATAEEALRHINGSSRLFLDYAQGKDLAAQEAAEPKYPDYQLPGGSNYRELLLTLPYTEGGGWEITTRADGKFVLRRPDGSLYTGPSGDVAYWSNITAAQAALAFHTKSVGAFTGGHYGETPNVLAHVRFNERETADGQRVVFVEEIQSDLHQEGRKKGYAGPPSAAAPSLEWDERLAGEWWVGSDAAGNDWSVDLIHQPANDALDHQYRLTEPGTGRASYHESLAAAQARAASDSANTARASAVPDAPFKQSWPTLALKRVLKWAADNGFEGVAWTTGRQQVERYETAYRQAVDEIGWTRIRDEIVVSAVKGGQSAAEFRADERGVITQGPGGEAVGETLESLVGKEIAKRILSEDSGSVSGDNLTIGGAGMEGFYDKILPAAANKLGKRYGVKVGRTEVPTEKGSVGGGVPARYPDRETVHHLPIPPAMAEAVKAAGFSTFAPKFAAKGGRVPVPRGALPAIESAAASGVTPRPDLAMPSVDPALRTLTRMADIIRDILHKPGVRTNAEARALAETALHANFGGVKEYLMRKTREAPDQSVQVLNQVEVIAMRLIANTVGQRALQTGSEADLMESMHVYTAYRESGTEAARSLQARREAIDTETTAQLAMADIIARPTVRTQKELERLDRERREAGVSDARRDEIGAEMQALLAAEAKKLPKLLKALRRNGIDPTAIVLSDFADPVTASRIRRIVSTTRASTGDKLSEWYISSILSGPYTQWRNIRGNAVNVGVSLYVQRVVEASINTVVRAPNAPQLGELRVMARAQGAAIAEAGRRFLMAYRTESSTAMNKDMEDRVSKWMERQSGPAIGGPIGRGLRGVSLTSLLAFDEAFKGYIETVEQYALAYRKAKGEGRKGPEETFTRMNELVSLGDPEIVSGAEASALYLTFQNPFEAGSLLQKFEDAIGTLRRKGDPLGIPGPGTMFFTFIKTPMRLLLAALRRSPLAYLSMMSNASGLLRAGHKWKGGKAQMVTDIADSIIATGLGLVVLGWLEDGDDDDPIITGSPAENFGERQVQYGAAPPYTIRINGKRVSYRQIDPLSNALAITVDAANKWRQATKAGDPDAELKASVELFRTVYEHMKDATYLQGLQDLQRLIEYRSAPAAADTLANYVTAYVPNIIKQPMRMTDEHLREERARRFEDAGWAGMLRKEVARGIAPGHAMQAPAKRDLWGRRIERGQPWAWNPRGSWMANVVQLAAEPLHEPEGGPNKLDRMLLHWNEKVASQPVGGALKPFNTQPPSYHYTEDGKTRYWDEEEFEEFVRDSGQAALERILSMPLNWDDPTEKDIARVHAAVLAARRPVRSRLKAARKREGR